MNKSALTFKITTSSFWHWELSPHKCVWKLHLLFISLVLSTSSWKLFFIILGGINCQELSSNKQETKSVQATCWCILSSYSPSFPWNSWWGKAMGKAGSKVLREASVDGIQGQVQAASSHADSHSHTNVCRTSAETHTKSVHPLRKRWWAVRAPGWWRACVRACPGRQKRDSCSALQIWQRYATSFHTSTAHLHFYRLHHRTFNRGELLPSCGPTVNSWWLSRVEQRQSLDVLGIIQILFLV